MFLFLRLPRYLQSSEQSPCAAVRDDSETNLQWQSDAAVNAECCQQNHVRMVLFWGMDLPFIDHSARLLAGMAAHIALG